MAMSIRPDLLTERLAGRVVSHVSTAEGSRLEIHFADGVVLTLEAGHTGFTAHIGAPVVVPRPVASGPQLTKRQLDYLRFITKYILRFRRPPAESDIQRHFLVSAPSVNQMVQTLERRGFITREPGVPRSICVCFAVSDESEHTAGPR